MLDIFKIIPARDVSKYKSHQRRFNNRYAFASAVVLTLIMLFVSRGPLMSIYHSQKIPTLLSFDYHSVFLCYLMVFASITLAMYFYNGRYKHYFTISLMVGVLSMTFMLGLKDVWAGSGTMAFGLGVLFVASFYSMKFIYITVFYPLYFFAFYCVAVSVKSFGYTTEYAPLVGLTMLLAVAMEMNRQRQYRDRLIIKRQVKTLQSTNQKLEEALGMKDSFISQISHELKTPLNAIIGFSSLIMKPESKTMSTDVVQEYGQYINEGGNHLLELINNILMLNKNKAGKLVAADDLINVEEAINEIMAIINEEATRKGHVLAFTLPPTLPLVRADKMMFKQVMMNILSNAVKYTPKGGIVRLKADVTDKGMKLVVADTGVGMSEEEREQALEPFEQVENILSREVDGTGLGLSIVLELCELMDVDFDIQSAKGKGTTVTFTFNI